MHKSISFALVLSTFPTIAPVDLTEVMLCLPDNSVDLAEAFWVQSDLSLETASIFLEGQEAEILFEDAGKVRFAVEGQVYQLTEKQDAIVYEHLNADFEISEGTCKFVPNAPKFLSDIAEIEARLSTFEAALVQALLERDEAVSSRDDLATQLAASLAAKEALEAGLNSLRNSVSESEIANQLAQALEAKLAIEAELAEEKQNIEALKDRFARVVSERTEAQLENKDNLRDLGLLNQQVAQLRSELSLLQNLIDEAEAKDVSNQVEITNLGNRLNTALTRSAATERRLRRLEEENSSLLAALAEFENQSK